MGDEDEETTEPEASAMDGDPSILKAIALDLREFLRDLCLIMAHLIAVWKLMVVVFAISNETAIATAVTVVGTTWRYGPRGWMHRTRHKTAVTAERAAAGVKGKAVVVKEKAGVVKSKAADVREKLKWDR